MRILPVLAIGCTAAVLGVTAQAQTTFSQFFNNNNGSFTDNQSANYNWTTANAAGLAMQPNDVGAGNVFGGGSGYVPSPGEVTLARGALFVVPLVNDATQVPLATIKATTHLGTSNVLQNDPQPDWYVNGPMNSMAGITVDDITLINVRSSSGAASGVTTYIGLQLNGSSWVFASTGFNIVGGYAEYALSDLTSFNWYTGVYDGVNVNANITASATTTLTGDEVVTGYAYYGDTGLLAGNASRVRLDKFEVTAIPEPSTYAFIFGLGVIGLAIWRRRR
jgi:hypothetical protein